MLSDVESQAPRLEALGQDIARSARLSRDIAAPIREFVSRVPEDRLEPDQLARQIEGWRTWQAAADQLETTGTMVNSFVALTLTNTTTSTGMVSTVLDARPPEQHLQFVIEDVQSRLYRVVVRFPLMDGARASMRRLNLHIPSGTQRAPLDLLEEARGALERPVVQEGGPVSVLIPLRECINAVISELLRRRPVQDPTPKIRDKIASIARCCCRPGLDEAHFERIAAETDALLNQLSGAKQTAMARERLSDYFHRGLLLLDALMNSIDEQRLRKSP